MWKLANRDVTLVIDYTIDGEFVTPTSASYEVLLPDSTVVSSGVLPAAGTTEPITLLAADNTLTGEYGTRFILVTFAYEGKEYHFQRIVYLSSFLPLTGTPEQVRQTLGLDQQELPDSAVDLYHAYFRLRWQNGDAFKDAFSAGGEREQAANRAVVLKAALEICSSLEMRTLIYVKSEDSMAQRSTKIDFERLTRVVDTQLADALNVATDVALVDSVLFALSNPADPFTG